MGLLNLFRKRIDWIHIEFYHNSNTGFLIVPNGKDKKFGDVAIEPVIKLNCDVSEQELGEGLLSSFTVTEQAMSVLPRIIQRRKNPYDVIAEASGIKNFSKFSKLYRCFDLSRSQQGYKIQELHRESEYGSYLWPSDDNTAVHLPLDAAALALGQAVMACLAIKHEIPAADSIMNFQLFDGRTMRFSRPPDDYANIGDAHTDAHQVFEYAEKNDVYFGFSYGTDYDPLDFATVKKIWERYYGSLSAFEFSQTTKAPFSYIAQAEGSGRIIRSLFFTDGGIWNEFLLHANTSGLTKKQVKRILADYETVADSCVITD